MAWFQGFNDDVINELREYYMPGASQHPNGYEVEIYYVAYMGIMADYWEDSLVSLDTDNDLNISALGLHYFHAGDACNALEPDLSNPCSSKADLTEGVQWAHQSVFRDNSGHAGTMADQTIGLTFMHYLYGGNTDSLAAQYAVGEYAEPYASEWRPEKIVEIKSDSIRFNDAHFDYTIDIPAP